MSATPELKLDWCSHAAAKYAVEHWHYSRALPTPPIVHIGVWEQGVFVGVVLFSRGSTRHLGRPYGLETTQLCELTRVALRPHAHPVSRLLAIALRLLAQQQAGLRLVVSFADPNQGHVGTIYQASGWRYTGMTAPSAQYVDSRGRRWHERQVSPGGLKKQYGRYRRVPTHAECVKIALRGKHRYLYPLDAAMRAQIAPLAQPYPKRATSILADAPTDQAGESGAAPTVALAGIE